MKEDKHVNDYLICFKVSVAAFVTAVAAFLGWKGILCFAWVVAMAIDYASGTAAAWKSGNWSSSVARQGLWHKGGMILVVTVSAIADGVMDIVATNLRLGISWPGLVLPLVLTWYILTELGSMLENAAAMGAPIPPFLAKALAKAQQVVDDADGRGDDG